MSIKILWLDSETSGISLIKDEIIQISGICEEIDDDGKRKVLDVFDIKMRPSSADIVEEEALEVMHLTLDEVMAYPDRKEGFKKLLKHLDKCVDKFNTIDKMVLAGYNIGFDRRFMEVLFKEFNHKYIMSYLHFETIDVMSLVGMLRISGKITDAENLKLSTICMHLGIVENDSAFHDSLADIRYTRKLFYKIEKMLVE